MGIAKTGNVSLQAIRQDLDLAGAGSMNERALRDKIQNKSGAISLNQFRGNILGMQYLTYNTSEAGWNKLRDRTAGTGYLMNQPNIRTDGARVYVPCTDNYSSDIGVEARLTGKVLESGAYTLSGSSFGEFDTNYYNGEMHINLIANAGGYLQGVNSILIDQRHNLTWAMGEKTWSYTVSLSTSRPFITVVFRNIHKSGGRGTTTTHQFWNWTLRR